MKTREEIFYTYLSHYSSHVATMKISNPFYVPDELSIVKFIKTFLKNKLYRNGINWLF